MFPRNSLDGTILENVIDCLGLRMICLRFSNFDVYWPLIAPEAVSTVAWLWTNARNESTENSRMLIKFSLYMIIILIKEYMFI